MAVTHRQQRAFQSTTLRLPKQIYEQAKMAIRKSDAASSFNDFVVQAVEEKVRKLTETEIDAAFSQMARDPQYRQDAIATADAFEKSDWEAMKSTEIVDYHVRRKTRPSKTRSR